MKRFPKTAAGLACALFALPLAGRAQTGSKPVFINEDVYQFVGLPQDNFEVLLQGHQTLTTIPIPIHPPQFTVFTADYSPTTDTTYLIFSGTPIPTDTTKTVHFGYGLNGGMNVSGQLQENPMTLHKYWSRTTSSGIVFTPVPVVNAGVNVTPGPMPQSESFLVLYFDGQFAGSPATPKTGDWMEFPIDPSGQSEITFDSPSGDVVSLSNARFFLSETQIPLEDLNRDLLPPTDPRFRLLNIPDGTVIGAGQKITVAVTPEPGAAALLVASCVAGMGLRFRRRR